MRKKLRKKGTAESVQEYVTTFETYVRQKPITFEVKYGEPFSGNIHSKSIGFSVPKSTIKCSKFKIQSYKLLQYANGNFYASEKYNNTFDSFVLCNRQHVPSILLKRAKVKDITNLLQYVDHKHAVRLRKITETLLFIKTKMYINLYK